MRYTTSRCLWKTAIILPTLILGSALTLWFAPTASPTISPTEMSRPVSPPMTVMTTMSKPLWAAETKAITVPKPGCQTKWCDRVRTTQRIARKLLAGLQRWERANGNVSPLSEMTVLLDIIRATRAENRSPFLTVAISGKESSFGTAYPCRSPNGDGAGRYNLTGLASCWAPDNWKTINLCGKTINGPSYVTSYARGMGLTARLIRCLVLNARTVYEINGYAASASWKPAVHSIMVDVFRVPDHVMWDAAVKAVR